MKFGIERKQVRLTMLFNQVSQEDELPESKGAHQIFSMSQVYEHGEGAVRRSRSVRLHSLLCMT